MDDSFAPRLILASASPRRRELLGLLGLPFEVRAAGVAEQPGQGEAPETYVRRVAGAKAEAVAAALPPAAGRQLIIAADTEVVLDDRIMGKPGGAAEAGAMLARLRGRRHEVLSAVVALDAASGRRAETLCRSVVPVRNYSAAELAAYVASGDPLDKAGGYAIQHAAFHPVEGFAHCYASVMGLPLCHLSLALRRLGIQAPGDVPAACQGFNHYQCPVYAGILDGRDGGAAVVITGPIRPVTT